MPYTSRGESEIPLLEGVGIDQLDGQVYFKLTTGETSRVIKSFAFSKLMSAFILP